MSTLIPVALQQRPANSLVARHMRAAAAVGLGLCAVIAYVTVVGRLSDRPWLAAIGRVAIFGIPVAVGMWELRQRPSARLERLVLGVAAVLFLFTLAGSSNPALYSLGRLGYWGVEVGAVALMLSFPIGRFPERIDRTLAVALLLLVAAFYLPTALLADRYPTPAPTITCGLACPHNAFQIVAHQPALVHDVLSPLRDGLGALLVFAVAIRLAVRVRRASWLMRLAIAPVLGVATLRLAALATLLVLRRADALPATLNTILWVYALLLPAVAVAFLAGLAAQRVFAGAALERLAAGLQGAPTADEVRATMRSALHDPRLQIAYRSSSGTGWIGTGGEPFLPPPPGSGLSTAEVGSGDDVSALIVHDAALDDRPALLEASTALAGMALRNQRLGLELDSMLHELRASQARIIAAADDERERIERDLHDGAQQRLLALQMKLALASELVAKDPVRGRAALDDVGHETIAALEEVRSLARGVYPPLLSQFGLVSALRTVAMRAPVPVALDAERVGRYTPPVEKAVYFCCLEALQNATKHSGGAVSIRLHADAHALEFEVADDGTGFDPAVALNGSGLAGIRDRLASVDGDLQVDSLPGAGTSVRGTVPVD